MLEIIYWLGTFYKTLALLTLIVFISQTKYKTQISQGFLWLLLNEIIFMFLSFFIQYSESNQQYQYFNLCQLIMNVYFVVIYLIIFTWLIKLKKNVVSKNVDVLSIVFILFSWIAFLIVACFAVSSQQISNMRNLSNISFGLGWVLCLLKFCVQYNHSKNNQIGLNYLLLIFNICWISCQIVYQLFQAQIDVMRKVMLTTFGVCIIAISMLLIIQRKNNIKNIEQLLTLNQTPVIQPVDDSILNDSLLDKNKKSDLTHYTSSFGESVDNY